MDIGLFVQNKNFQSMLLFAHVYKRGPRCVCMFLNVEITCKTDL